MRLRFEIGNADLPESRTGTVCKERHGVKERGILFSAPMVRAILRETDPKWQTRRLVKPQPNRVHDLQSRRNQVKGDIFIGPDFFVTDEQRLVFAVALSAGSTHCAGLTEFCRDYCPYGTVGDQLYVKETFAAEADGRIVYKADRAAIYSTSGRTCGGLFWLPSDYEPKRWKPSIFMPRWASRLTLEITEVRGQRLQEISEEDAKAEGLISDEFPIGGEYVRKYGLEGWEHRWFRQSPIDAYERIWQSIHGPGSWEKNPWVFAISFRRIK